MAVVEPEIAPQQHAIAGKSLKKCLPGEVPGIAGDHPVSSAEDLVRLEQLAFVDIEVGADPAQIMGRRQGRAVEILAELLAVQSDLAAQLGNRGVTATQEPQV